MTFYATSTQAEANAIDAQIVANVRAWVEVNMPEAVSPEGHLRGRNAATGELSDAVTTRWDEPRALTDGRFAILKPTAERVLPIPISVVLNGITATEITQADYEAALPAPSSPLNP